MTKVSFIVGVCLLASVQADLKKVNFLDTKIKGERVRIGVFTNQESKKYYKTDYIPYIVGAGDHVRFKNGHEGLFFLDKKGGMVKFVCTDVNRYTYFGKDFSGSGSAYLEMPTSVTVDKDGNLFVMDFPSSRIHYLKLDVDGKTYNHSGWKQKYLVAEQSHQIEFLTHVNDAGHKMVFAMNDMGRIHVLNYDLTPVLDAAGNPIVHVLQFPGLNFRKLKSDHLLDGNVATLYTINRPPNEKSDGGFSNDGWLEIKFDVVQKRFLSERFVEADKNDFIREFRDIQPFYVAGPSGPRMRMMVLDNSDGLHEYFENGQLAKTVVSGLDESDPRFPKSVLEIREAFSLASCNDRRSYEVCRNLIVAEDFRNTGRGLIRYQYVPNPGDEYYIPMDIQMRENNSGGNSNQPDTRITNLSSVDVLSHFTVRYWMSKEEFPTQTLGADKYYFNPDSIQMSTGAHPLNPNLVYVDLTFPSSFELLPGETTPDLGMRFGAHFKNYWPGAWNRANDWSWNGISSSYRGTKNITVYDEDGHLVYGIEPNPNDTPQPPSHPSTIVFGFEDHTQWNSASATLSSSSMKTQGNYSMSASGSGWFVFNSAYMKTQDITGETSHLALDLYVPGNQPSPWWIGSISLVANCNSGNVYDNFLGNIELTPLPQGQFSTVTFNVPQNVLTALQGDYDDFSIRFEVSLNSGAPPLLLDNLRFVP